MRSAAPPQVAYRIEGKVLKPDTVNHAGILVYCAGTSHLAYTDEQGNYAITGVPQGTYRLYCQHPDYQPAFIAEISLAEGFADANAPVVVPAKTLEPKMTPSEQAERVLCSVMGQAILADRPTAEGIIVRAVGTDFRTVTDADGNYQLLRLDPGQYTLVFEKPGYRTQRRTVRLVSGDLLFPDQIVLEPLESRKADRVLDGSVALLDPLGQPISGFAGVIVYLEGTSRVTMAAPDGFFQFDRLEPARYVVAAMAPGYFSRDRVEVDLSQAQRATVALTLQSLEQPTSAPGTLVGRVLRDDPQDVLLGTLVGLVELGATVMTDASGRYVFPDLPPGTYTIVAQAQDYDPASIEGVVVGEGETVEAPDLLLEKRRDYPRVLFTIPADGEKDVTVREVVPVVIRFSKQMRPESLRAAFSISPPVAYALCAGREHPQSDFDRLYVELYGFGGENALRFDKTYTISLSTEAQDFENLHLQQPYRFRFRTGKASVIYTRPPDGAVNVYVDSALYRVTVFFNAPLDPKTVTPEKVRVRPSPGAAVQLSVIDDPASGWSHVDLTTNWQPGVRYTVTLTGGIRTTDGSRVSNLPFTFSFTTSAGRAIDFSPARARGRR